VKHVIRPAAQDDIIRQFRYYLMAGADEAATRFLDTVEESIDAICQMPHIGAPKLLKNPNLAGLRSWGVKGFEDILIFYLVRPDALRVVRVLHGRRDLKRILRREKRDDACG
jgi:plasmid stabilization system protein ParE